MRRVRQADYAPILPTGLAIMAWRGRSAMPILSAGSADPGPTSIVRSDALISVNQQVGGSIGVSALMSVLLT